MAIDCFGFPSEKLERRTVITRSFDGTAIGNNGNGGATSFLATIPLPPGFLSRPGNTVVVYGAITAIGGILTLRHREGTVLSTLNPAAATINQFYFRLMAQSPRHVAAWAVGYNGATFTGGDVTQTLLQHATEFLFLQTTTNPTQLLWIHAEIIPAATSATQLRGAQAIGAPGSRE